MLPYSPELNLIEILWRFIKYKWLWLTAYLSQDDLYSELMVCAEKCRGKIQVNFCIGAYTGIILPAIASDGMRVVIIFIKEGLI